MIKIFLVSLVLQFSLNAGIINAISVIVNDEPITLVDIDNKMTQAKISKEQATAVLIDEILYKQELQKYNIKIDQFDIDRHIEKLAKNNNMSFFAFKNAVSQQQDYKKFEKGLSEQLKHQKLIGSIAANKIINATEEDLKIYYDNNPQEFKFHNKFNVIHYTSKNKLALENIKKNPMMRQAGVNINNTTLLAANQSPQIRYVLAQTDENTYSAIFPEKGFFHLFYISDKSDETTLEFDKVKEKIYAHVMQTRQEEFLKNYFESLKITAEIKRLR